MLNLNIVQMDVLIAFREQYGRKWKMELEARFASEASMTPAMKSLRRALGQDGLSQIRI